MKEIRRKKRKKIGKGKKLLEIEKKGQKKKNRIEMSWVVNEN